MTGEMGPRGADGITRILYVTDQLEIGGAEKQLIEIVKGMDRGRFEPYLFCAIAGGPLYDAFAEHCAEVFVHRRRRRLDLGGMRELARTTREYGIDIVHSWLWYSNIFCYLTTRLARAPHWLMSVRGIPLGFTRAHALVEARAVGAAGHITTVSQFNARHVQAEYGVSARKISVIYNGIIPTGGGGGGDLRALAERGRPIIGCVANFGREKGHCHLIAAMPEVLAVHPAALLLLAGDGALRDEAVAQVESMGLAEHVLFLGSRSDVPALLGILDLMVLPSLSEGTPNVILEAMVARVPVVATRVGGTPEVVDEGASGLLVPPGEPRALAGAMLEILSDRERGGRMADAGAELAQRRFGMGRMVREYEALYADVMSGGA